MCYDVGDSVAVMWPGGVEVLWCCCCDEWLGNAASTSAGVILEHSRELLSLPLVCSFSMGVVACLLLCWRQRRSSEC